MRPPALDAEWAVTAWDREGFILRAWARFLLSREDWLSFRKTHVNHALESAKAMFQDWLDQTQTTRTRPRHVN